MKRHVLTLCLLCTAMTMTGVLGVSSASATEFHSDSSSGNTWATNTTTTGTSHKFDAAGTTITCTTASFKGTASGKTVSAVNITPTYGNCTFFGVPVTVNMGNCEFEFTANGAVAIVDQTGVNCGTEGKTIDYKASFLGVWCEVIIGEQTGLTTITYAGSTTAGGSITVTPTVTGISYQAVGMGCSKGGPQTDGNYTVGTTTMTGYVDESGVEKASTPIWAA